MPRKSTPATPAKSKPARAGITTPGGIPLTCSAEARDKLLADSRTAAAVQVLDLVDWSAIIGKEPQS